MAIREEALGAGAAVPFSVRDQREIADVYKRLRAADAKLVGADGKAQILPDTLYSFLCMLLRDLKVGRSVTILQSDASLTTVEASRLLGMSRQFLIGLLEKREMPCHMVGTHRRVYIRDVVAYKAKRDSARSKTLDDLARAEAEEGIYDRVPDDFRSGQ